MGYVRVRVIEKGDKEDLLRWKNHMLEEPKCWNKFCFDCYEKEELHATRVIKEGNESDTYIITLCEDCTNKIDNHDILVNENHLMVETN